MCYDGIVVQYLVGQNFWRQSERQSMIKFYVCGARKLRLKERIKTPMIQKAAAFAARVHEGAVRKGTRLPYIVHPMEAALIVSLLTDDPEVIAAAYLHDVIEDAGVSYEELLKEFGRRVADLVQAESEDKSKTWKERKQFTVDHIGLASKEAKIIAFGDKLSNLRSTAKDYLVMGDEIWAKFHEKDKQMHAWYYGSLAEAFREFDGHPFYQEYCLLLDQVFHDKWFI